MRMLGFCLLFFLLHPLGITAAGQEEAIQVLHLHEQNPSNLHSPSKTTNPPPISVSVSASELHEVSFSVLAAENWLKTHVLAHYPSTRISTIVVGRGVLCSRDNQHLWSLVLPSVKNLYYSLVRWGLVSEIKVLAALSSDCLQEPSFPFNFRGDIAQNVLKPLMSFFQETSLGYVVDDASSSSHSFSGHRFAIERLDISGLRGIGATREAKPMSRKLSSLRFPSYPDIPKATNPIPPPSQFAPVPDGSFSFVPDASPAAIPAGPPDASVVPPPPCQAAAPAPSPGAGEERKGGLWCVAKPTVPSEKLQEAIDYACGEGRVNCEAIMPNGNCFSPDNVVAHASYAFNSYWQKTKQTGGSCSFDGTALLINSDPSFLHCRFILG